MKFSITFEPSTPEELAQVMSLTGVDLKAGDTVTVSTNDGTVETPAPPAPEAPAAAPAQHDMGNLDAEGLPWDERIHAKNKSQIGNGTWRKRKGIDKELVATVEAELRALVTPPAVGDAEEPAATTPIAPAPTAPPAPPAPPVAAPVHTDPLVKGLQDKITAVMTQQPAANDTTLAHYQLDEAAPLGDQVLALMKLFGAENINDIASLGDNTAGLLQALDYVWTTA